MRKYFAFIGLLMLVTGCKEVDKLTQFNMDYNESVVIPSAIGINLPYNIYTPNIETNSETDFAVNDTRKDLIEQIVLKNLELTLTDPQNADFGFIKSIKIYMSADDLPEVKIAWNENIPSDIGATLNLECSVSDLKDYIKKDEFTLRINTVTDEILTTDYHIDLHAVFFVDAKILGI